MREERALPSTWELRRIDEIGEVRLGRQRSPQHHTGDHMRPYLRVANVFEDRIDLGDVMEMNFTPEEAVIYELQPGDILLNEGQSLELVGRPAMYRGELPGVCFTNTLVRFRAGAEVDPQYALRLFQYCMHIGRFRKIAAITTNLAHLGASRFGSLRVPLPPLREQRRIADILDKADAVRRKRREALALTDNLLHATFLEMFGDPVTNPRGWQVEALGTLADLASGVTKGKQYGDASLVERPYLRVANVQAGRLVLDEVKSITVSSDDAERYKLAVGDVLMTEGGDPDKLGRGTVWRGEVKDCIHQNHIFRARVDTTRVVPEFLSAQLGSARGQRYFARAAKQTTGIASINMTQLKSFPALVPPLDRQREFAEATRFVRDNHCQRVSAAEAADALFASLQHRAFRGEL